jgi:hypothetical protein
MGLELIILSDNFKMITIKFFQTVFDLFCELNSIRQSYTGDREMIGPSVQ